MIVPLVLKATNIVMLVLLSLNEAVVMVIIGGAVAGIDVACVDVDTVVVVVKSGSQDTVCSLAPGAFSPQL
jgi:hypothetical protein